MIKQYGFYLIWLTLTFGRQLACSLLSLVLFCSL